VHIPLATGPTATSTREQLMQLLWRLTVGTGDTLCTDAALKQMQQRYSITLL